MSYQVLARKWRPQTFSDVVGQEHVLIGLKNGLSIVRIHNAYLFSGTRGVGKTSIARLLAKGLNCETGITSIPCGLCDNCKEIEQGCFIDLIEIDAASRTRVEDTRDLLYHLQYAPARGRFKVYLIDEVHMLSRHSFNALLKTLEEPPSHVKFLLATTEPKKLPITILSRCLQFHLKELSVNQILIQLQRITIAEGIIADPCALQLLACAGKGSMRDALSLTDQAISMGIDKITKENVLLMLGSLDNEQPLSIIEALVDKNSEKVVDLIEQSALLGVDWENLIIEILTLLHRIAMFQVLPNALDTYYSSVQKRLRKLSCLLTPSDLQYFYQIALTGRKDLNYAPSRRMGVEMMLLRALSFHLKLVIDQPVDVSEKTLQIIQMQSISSSDIQTDTVSNDASINNSASLPDKNCILQKEETANPKKSEYSLSHSTDQLLQERNHIHQRSSGIIDPKPLTKILPEIC
ncbi:DNA polymerase III subunit tau [Candidatus Profftia tarda]|uniref:DNA polymerase III subunit gamma/tau n=1 Tax=Candidatus Profftia tarda TaxID=1177216 RepID=A0A8E4F1B4_9ENTR|nr:DNA polymerase III subunit gamma/tau [Candidatus Profftia tarda]CAD6509820.1 DNA polymerase III subunit tau [Candidatus Profftia tarda]